jgi:hypothetical protein
MLHIASAYLGLGRSEFHVPHFHYDAGNVEMMPTCAYVTSSTAVLVGINEKPMTAK